MSLKVSISGIRGILGNSLTPPVLCDYLCAFATYIQKTRIPNSDDYPLVILGRDTRPSGSAISLFVKSVLRMQGIRIIDLGIAPTPMVLYTARILNADGGIIITASHNPDEWNAFKFVKNGGIFLTKQDFQNYMTVFSKKDYYYADHKVFIPLNKDDKIDSRQYFDKYFQNIKQAFDINNIKKRNFKVGIDPVNGAGAIFTSNFLKELNCEVFAINNEQSGVFPHNPEPKPENLKDLAELIGNHNCDVGFAQDPDADRLVLVDEKGNVLSEELTLALCVKHYLTSVKSDVVINLSTSRMIEDIANACQCRVFRTPTGEINVVEKLLSINADIGGEGNGGVIMRNVNPCRDSFVGIVMILELLAAARIPLSELVEQLPKYSMIKEKIVTEDFQADNMKNKLQAKFPAGTFDFQDGIRLDIDKSWIQVRQSNTEPVVRIIAESLQEKDTLNMIQKVKELL